MNASVLRTLLHDHPDRQLVDYVVEGFEIGFELGLERRPHPRPPCKNLKKALEFPDKAQELIDRDVAKGHVLGPFDHPPYFDIVYSPINIVDKAGSPNEFRLIHDLSFPYTDQSINSCIPADNASVQYEYIDRVIEILLDLGPSAWGSRIDLRSAYRNLAMRESQLPLLAFTFRGKIYINCTLPFGASSSCLIFERVARSFQWIVTNETRNTNLSHYLDDFPLFGHTRRDLELFMQQFFRDYVSY